ncbi:MAG: patatin-like phospholipase family protein, partial [Pseudobdellovibrionaceae bacterium]
EQKPIPPAPKVGLILGPGAIKAFAHIGVLQEFARKRVQIHSIAGLEFGALIAGFYAVKGQPFEPEWQLFKIKEDDLIGKQLLTSAIKSKNPEDLRGFFASTLPKIDIDETRVPFTCPIWDLNKNQTLMMTRGSLDESLMTCMSFAPLYQPFQDKWIGAAFDLKSTSDQLRSQGANLIIYVNVIGQNENLNLQDYEKWLWSLTQGQLQKQMKGVDYVVNVDTSGIGLADFGARKVLVQKGVQAAKNVADQMIQKFGL